MARSTAPQGSSRISDIAVRVFLEPDSPTTKMQLDGLDLHRASERKMNSVRGNKFGVLLQQPIRMLDPTSSVWSQPAEPLRLGRGRETPQLTLVAPAPEVRCHRWGQVARLKNMRMSIDEGAEHG